MEFIDRETQEILDKLRTLAGGDSALVMKVITQASDQRQDLPWIVEQIDSRRKARPQPVPTV